MASPDPPRRRRVHPLLWILIATGVLGLAAWLFVGWINFSILESYRTKRERALCRCLLSIADAQELVRAGTGDYWRKDVAGLADLPLIDSDLALADDRAPRRIELLGSLFRALPFSDEATSDPKRYAVHCFPVRPLGPMYALTQDRTLWRKPAIAGGVDVFPADPAAEGWERTP